MMDNLRLDDLEGDEAVDWRAARARALRAAGLSRSQILAEIGPASGRQLGRWLAGTTPPEWTRRPRAKDADRQRARELRTEGKPYRAIAAELGVSISSVCLWVRDLPAPPTTGRPAEAMRETNRRRWEKENRRRDIDRQRRKLAAANNALPISQRDLFVAGVALYWAEGSKDKPYARREGLEFVNSDPNVVRLFSSWLDLLRVEQGRRVYRILIHETADVDAAERFWSETLSIDRSIFRRPTLKRHNPRTVRKNVDGTTYHGCLTIRILQSAELYQKVEGWWYALAVHYSR